MLISRRMLKASAGNWGKPNKVEKKKELKESLIQEEPHTKAHRRKKKDKKPYILPFTQCPFCEKELPIDKKRVEEENKKLKNRGLAVLDWMYVVTTCPSCKSYEVTYCPACKRKTWFNPTTRMYKHQKMGCGFIGGRKE